MMVPNSATGAGHRLAFFHSKIQGLNFCALDVKQFYNRFIDRDKKITRYSRINFS